jgi:ABC-2 type transport system ATP-binding protein
MLRSLAGQGRSILVSSHLLSEMALMADSLVVIGRGTLIASGRTSDFISTSRRNAVVVRVDDPDPLARELRIREAVVVPEGGRLVVTGNGVTTDAVGGLAFDLGLRVFELVNREATLEEAFLDATGASEEFRASMGFGGHDGSGAPPPGQGFPPPDVPPPGPPPPGAPGASPAGPTA